jgi:hypothetical protein
MGSTALHVSRAQVTTSSIKELRFDTFAVPVDGAVAACTGENDHVLAGTRVGGRPAGTFFFVVSHSRPGVFCLQGALTGTEGTWEIPVKVNEDGTYNRRPVWMMVVATNEETARKLEPALPRPDSKRNSKIPQYDWQVLAKIRVAKFPDGFKPFGLWSAW